MQHTATRPARMPVRVALVALLLAGLGLWQSWQCGAEMSPLLLPVTTVTADAGPHHAAMTWHPEGPSDDGGHGLLAACLSVLASIAAAFWLMADPLRLLALLRRAGLTPLRAAGPPPRTATLAQLCILRT
ncbi:hypothetical protein [Catellatospora sp. IY07-71]|uniref:hypothetical protein n=1 Tax=Catellatospora sp. IY07-71 TaxID=2728827 RepID=UPI001BB3D2E7|nr:hypothetical protein [Catellatospora sp. IY07-71]